jgi:hypothetical protein
MLSSWIDTKNQFLKEKSLTIDEDVIYAVKHNCYGTHLVTFDEDDMLSFRQAGTNGIIRFRHRFFLLQFCQTRRVTDLILLLPQMKK